MKLSSQMCHGWYIYYIGIAYPKKQNSPIIYYILIQLYYKSQTNTEYVVYSLYQLDRTYKWSKFETCKGPYTLTRFAMSTYLCYCTLYLVFSCVFYRLITANFIFFLSSIFKWWHFLRRWLFKFPFPFISKFFQNTWPSFLMKIIWI